MLSIRPFLFRLKLVGWHLVISATLLGSLTVLFMFRWYSWPAWYLSGADRVLGLMILVDIVMGPCITFIVSSPRKVWRKLKRDLMIIALVQLCALVWGSHALWQARPLYMVFTADRFELIQATQIPEEEKQNAIQSKSDYVPNEWRELVWVWAELPSSAKESSDILLNAAFGGVDISAMPRYFHSLQEGRSAILSRMASIQNLRDALKNKDFSDKLVNLEHTDQIGVLPVLGRERSGILLLDRVTLSPISFLEVDPYSLSIWPQKPTTQSNSSEPK